MVRGGAAPPSERTATGQPRCVAQTRHGTRCGAFATGGVFCRIHDPDQRDAVRAGCAKGARAASQVRALKARRPPLDTTSGLVAYVAMLIGDVVDGRVPPDVARTALYGASIQRQLIEASDLERRLAALESQLATGGRGRQWQG